MTALGGRVSKIVSIRPRVASLAQRVDAVERARVVEADTLGLGAEARPHTLQEVGEKGEAGLGPDRAAQIDRH